MKSLFLLSVSIISLIASGCQPVTSAQLAKEMSKFGNGTGSTEAKVDVTQTSLAGTWESACIPDTSNVAKVSAYRIDSLNITSNYIASTSEYFYDSNCRTAMFTQESEGNFTLAPSSTDMTILVALVDVSFTPQHQRIVDQFHNDSFCGVTLWTLGNLQFIGTPSLCGVSPNYKAKIARNGSNELYLNSLKFLKK